MAVAPAESPVMFLAKIYMSEDSSLSASWRCILLLRFATRNFILAQKPLTGEKSLWKEEDGDGEGTTVWLLSSPYLQRGARSDLR